MTDVKVGDRIRITEFEEGEPVGHEATVTWVNESDGSVRYPDSRGGAYGAEGWISSEYCFEVIDRGNPVSHPSHYQIAPGLEAIDVTKHFSFLRGNSLKYLLRADKKGNAVEDLEKAKQYIDFEIEELKRAEG